MWSKKWSNLNLEKVKAMCGEFGEVTVIIGLVINFLAFVSPLCAFRDTSSYVNNEHVRTRGHISANVIGNNL